MKSRFSFSLATSSAHVPITSQVGTSYSSSTISATVSFAAIAQDHYLENFKVSRVTDYATSGLVNVTWADALRHPPPGEEETHRRFQAIDGSCNASVVVCADARDHFCTGVSAVQTAPADAGYLVMPHPRLRRQEDDDEAGREGDSMSPLPKEEEPLEDYKWGLAIACPNTQSTGIQWRKDKCVYKMGEKLDYKAVYNVKGMRKKDTHT